MLIIRLAAKAPRRRRPLSSNVRPRIHPVVYLQATKKAREYLGIGRVELAAPGISESRLGNWLVNVVPIGGRYGFLFESTRSLLSFPVFIGQRQPEPSDMPAFLAHGAGQLLAPLAIPKSRAAALLSEFDEVALCKAGSKSELGVHAAIAADYFHLMNRAGKKADIGAVIHEVNSIPRATLGWRTSFEVTKELLLGSEA